MSVGHNRELHKNGRTDRVAVWDVNSRGFKVGVRIPRGRGNFACYIWPCMTRSLTGGVAICNVLLCIGPGTTGPIRTLAAGWVFPAAVPTPRVCCCYINHERD